MIKGIYISIYLRKHFYFLFFEKMAQNQKKKIKKTSTKQ